MEDIKKIREAICKNRGGFADASDEQIRRMWNLLTDETKDKYLKSIERKSNVTGS
jgi:H2-forming N5,N10-methylenetetrahydromethanopterin dehydrogenase-like enzyme